MDWEKTGKRLQALRERNIDLIRYTCFVCHFNQANCDGNCEECDFDKDLDTRITREELSQVFNVGEAVINNWETGRTPIPLEELFLYCEITNKRMDEIIAFEK